MPRIGPTEAAFIAEVLGVSVERQQHIVSGCASCEYTTHDAPARGAGATHADPLVTLELSRGAMRAAPHLQEPE